MSKEDYELGEDEHGEDFCEGNVLDPKNKFMSIYTEHVGRWKDCTRCGLCKARKKIVLYRGIVPADVLFLGEAPGVSEDSIGKPFIGPAGKELDAYIEQAEKQIDYSPRKCWGNLVGCIPLAPNDYRKKEEPLPEEIAACWNRIEEFLRICNPKMIIAVGDLARKQCKSQGIPNRFRFAHVLHPAYILRLVDNYKKNDARQRTTLAIADAFEELKG